MGVLLGRVGINLAGIWLLRDAAKRSQNVPVNDGRAMLLRCQPIPGGGAALSANLTSDNGSWVAETAMGKSYTLGRSTSSQIKGNSMLKVSARVSDSFRYQPLPHHYDGKYGRFTVNAKVKNAGREIQGVGILGSAFGLIDPKGDLISSPPLFSSIGAGGQDVKPLAPGETAIYNVHLSLWGLVPDEDKRYLVKWSILGIRGQQQFKFERANRRPDVEDWEEAMMKTVGLHAEGVERTGE